ncbi:hypothetical protein [Treponema pedis]|uniref:Uncharacterized protein n=1 Tax=Treponema pedis TaxID=409322 RepID=A0A7S6WQT3_9SPIR|nr:hypothetical protein [Treponema pedis]QOW61643.1 hypothetical protein IFE08_04510 [Treponema pedis]
MDKNGNKIFGTARDVGNYAAGYIAGKKGLSWFGTRAGFDFYQLRDNGWPPREGQESQAAQLKGFNDGQHEYLKANPWIFLWMGE